MQLWFLGITILLLYRSEHGSANPLGLSQQSFSSLPSTRGGFHPVAPQHAQFAESIRDWFQDMKARIFDSVSPPEVPGIITQTKENLQEQKKLFDGIFVDLSRLSLDPQRDWGIRLGHWYLIKKEDVSVTDAWRIPQNEIPHLTPDDTDWPEYKFDDEAGMYVPMSSNKIPTIRVPDILSPGTDNSAEKAIEDPEDLPKSKQSAEILDPKE